MVAQHWQGSWLKAVQNVHALAAQAWPAGLAYQFVAKGVKS